MLFVDVPFPSVSLTYALMELALHPDMQTQLRSELLENGGEEPTFDQLVSGFPYLDAVMCEVLRLHSPAEAMVRQVRII